MQATQLSLFDEVPRVDYRITIHNREYRSVNLLGPKPTAERYDMLINDALCQWYDYADHNDEIYFDTIEARDEYKRVLDEVCETDEKGNNLDGWYKIGDFQNGKFVNGIKRKWKESIMNEESPIRKEIREKVWKRLDK